VASLVVKPAVMTVDVLHFSCDDYDDYDYSSSRDLQVTSLSCASHDVTFSLLPYFYETFTAALLCLMTVVITCVYRMLSHVVSIIMRTGQ